MGKDKTTIAFITAIGLIIIMLITTIVNIIKISKSFSSVNQENQNITVTSNQVDSDSNEIKK